MSDKIKIRTVTGGHHKDDLKGCYFVPSTIITGAYDFYDKNNNELKSGITGDTFDFSLNSLAWTISDLVISLTAANGKWTNNADRFGDEEDGTFQAQAGGGVDPDEDEDAAAASA